jgi:hypothetical protein
MEIMQLYSEWQPDSRSTNGKRTVIFAEWASFADIA